MNNDTEKADELLRKEIKELKQNLKWVVSEPHNYIVGAENRLRREISLFETILKDREALKKIIRDGERYGTLAYETAQPAFASQTETIIKILS